MTFCSLNGRLFTYAFRKSSVNNSVSKVGKCSRKGSSISLDGTALVQYTTVCITVKFTFGQNTKIRRQNRGTSGSWQLMSSLRVHVVCLWQGRRERKSRERYRKKEEKQSKAEKSCGGIWLVWSYSSSNREQLKEGFKVRH